MNVWDRAVLRSRQYVEEQERFIEQQRPHTVSQCSGIRKDADNRSISFLNSVDAVDFEIVNDKSEFAKRNQLGATSSIATTNTSWQSTWSRDLVAAAEYSSNHSIVTIKKSPLLPPRPLTAFCGTSSRSSLVHSSSRSSTARLLKLRNVSDSTTSRHQQKLDKVLAKHSALMKAKQEKRVHALQFRETRRDRADAARERYAQQLLWLKVLMLVKHTNGWWDTMKLREDDIRLAHRKLKAALLINRFMIRRKAIRMITLKMKYEQVLRPVLWRLRLIVRCIRRRLARRQVLTFFSDFGLQRMAFVVNKFRHNVVRLQHICIAYNACTSARMELLHLKWEEIERKVTMQVVEERHAASLLFAGRLRDGVKTGSKLLDVNKSKLPLLAYKVNRSTEQADGLQRDMKMAFDKIQNMQVEREALLMLKPKSMRKFLDPKVANDKRNLVPDKFRYELLRTYLSRRRKLHVKRINTREDKDKRSKGTVDVEDVKRILDGRLDGEDDDEERVLQWTTMVVLTGDAGIELTAFTEAEIRKNLKIREIEDKKRMDAIMEKYHNEDIDDNTSKGSKGSGSFRALKANKGTKTTSRSLTESHIKDSAIAQEAIYDKTKMQEVTI